MMLLREVVFKEKAQDWAERFEDVPKELVRDAKVTDEVGLGEDVASTTSVEAGEEILL